MTREPGIGTPLDILEWPDLANDIRTVDGNHDLGAGDLAAALTARGWTKRPAPAPSEDVVTKLIAAWKSEAEASRRLAAEDGPRSEWEARANLIDVFLADLARLTLAGTRESGDINARSLIAPDDPVSARMRAERDAFLAEHDPTRNSGEEPR